MEENLTNDSKFQQRFRYLGLSVEDLQRMAKFRPYFEKRADSFVKKFYDHITNFSNLKEIIDKNSTVERLGKTMRDYFISLTSPVIDEEYFQRRLFVGKRHQLIGLYPSWYLGAYRLYFEEISSIVHEVEKDEAEFVKSFSAFVKRIILDIQLIIDNYFAEQLEHIIKTQEQVGEAVKVVESIAGRTNILSLNASIEAARAGEAGRTFAVVAKEVRKLAEDSSRSSKKIMEMIDKNMHEIRQIKYQEETS
jgi:hypothetical protein